MGLRVQELAKMQIVPLSAFNDNYIWAIVADGHCVIVDPGDAAPAQTFLDAEGLRLSAILVTHRHHDHVDGIPALLARTSVPVFGPASIAATTHPVAEGDTIKLPDMALSAQVMDVPGHTEEHVAYLVGSHLFCGDTLFAAGCGRLRGTASPAVFHTSLMRIASLPDNTLIHCAHEYTMSNLRFAMAVEPHNAALQARQLRCQQLRERGVPTLPSRLDEERESNPFLRCDVDAVKRAVEARVGERLETPQAVFAALRRWKDEF